MDQRQAIENRIKEMYIDKVAYVFKDKIEAEHFVKNAAYYVEQEYQNEGHFRNESIEEFLCGWKADSVIHGVATRDYNWFL